MKRKAGILYILVAALILLQSACGKTTQTPTDIPVEVEETIPAAGDLLPDGVVLLPNTGGVGVEKQLSMALVDRLFYFNYNPIAATTWTSSNAEVASVDNAGIVTGRTKGTTKITAEVLGEDGKTYIFTSDITVGEPVDSLEPMIDNENLGTSFGMSSLSIPCYCSVMIRVETKDGTSTLLDDRLVDWMIQEPKIVSIENSEKIDDSFLLRPYEAENILKKVNNQFFYHNATIVGQQTGKTTIIIVSEGIRKVIDVEVIENEITSLKINPESIDIAVNQTRPAMAVGYTDEECPIEDLDVEWSIADTTIAAVKPLTGVVTGLSTGKTTLTAVYSNGLSAIIVVTVK